MTVLHFNSVQPANFVWYNVYLVLLNIILNATICCIFCIPIVHIKLGITFVPLALHRACCLALLDPELLPLVHKVC